MTLTNFPHDPRLDLDPWVGQRSTTFQFQRINGLTGEILTSLHPIRGGTLSHDTTRTIKRQLTLNLGVADTLAVDPLVDRIDVSMALGDGTVFPLGRYMFTDQSMAISTAGKRSNVVLNDEMFLVDQQLTIGVNGVGQGVTALIEAVLNPLPLDMVVEASPFISAESWSMGTGRGQVLESLAVSGDYLAPWFGNDRKIHFIRSFDPARSIPDLDFDAGNKVLREGIVQSSDLLTAPNRFIVISNSATDQQVPVVGVADIPPSAPHSLANRGFVIAQVQDLQLSSASQAFAVAQNLAHRQTIFETVTLSTAPDPRHDSYNVVRWQGENWLELAWTMELGEGGTMSHTLRRSYA
jgi:hypothetical protein